MKVGRLVSIGLFWSIALVPLGTGKAGPPATPGASPSPGGLAALPWQKWFEKNTTVTDKKTYVHIMWDANAVRAQFEGAAKQPMVAEAGRQLAALLYPRGATSDTLKVDIVFVAKRDEYGNPQWDSLERFAHLEFSRKKLLERPASRDDPKLGYDKFEISR
jgi:hypothetical protein